MYLPHFISIVPEEKRKKETLNAEGKYPREL